MGSQVIGVEKWKHKQIFESYLMMGPARSIQELSRLTGIPSYTLNTWRRSFDWDKRLDTRERQILAKQIKEDDEAYFQSITSRHLEAYQKIQEKSMEALGKKVVFDTGRDVAMALDIGVKGEREVLGLRDTKLKAAVVKEGFAAMIEMVMGPE